MHFSLVTYVNPKPVTFLHSIILAMLGGDEDKVENTHRLRVSENRVTEY
jgi:hypothetical protein